MKYQFRFADDTIKSIIDIFNNSLARAKSSADETEGFRNAISMEKYRYIYHSMSNQLIEGLTPLKLKINSWDFTVYFHNETSSLIGLISKANFESKRNNQTEILHYMAVQSEYFNIYQNDFEERLEDSQKRDLQLALKIEDDNPQVEKVMKSIYGGIDFDLTMVKQFALLVADFVHYEVVDLQAVVINENFDILYEEDWSKHIIISTNDDNDVDNKQGESLQHTMKLNIRKEILPKNTDEQNKD